MLPLNLGNPKPSSLSPQIPLPFFFPTHLPKTLPFPNPNNNRSSHNSLLVRASSSDSRALSQSAIKRIADKLRSLGYGGDDNPNPKHSSTPTPTSTSTSTSPGEIFLPLPNQLQKHRVGHTLDPSWSTPENPVPRPGSGHAIKRYNELKREFWKEKQEEKAKLKAEGREKLAPTLAELKLAAEELRRLRGVGIALRKKLKIGKAGITEGIVNGIHERWRRTELVKITCEDMSRLNMKRTHDLLERKTGGLVVWRSGSNIVLYRGVDYKYPYFIEGDVEPNDTSDGASVDLQMDSGVHGETGSYSSTMDGATSVRHHVANNATQPPLIQGVGLPNRVRFQLPGEAQLVEQADLLLDGLGPRFTDWYGYDPQPVDADLLPATVPGYRRPFRLLPYGVNSKLTNDEMTTLKRLGRPLPCHFALGRNRKLQGLAAAILKLWEKCEIAKIAVKRGVQNTNSSLMVDELKNLTGGIVLSRDKEYIVLYRGKDFLPAAVSSAIEQRRKFGIHAEERRIISSSSDAQQEGKNGRTESTSETGDGEMTDQKPIVVSDQKKLRSREVFITRTSTKLSLALEKKERAEKLLEKLEMEEIKQEPEVDKEGITEEERYMLRRVGLKMKPFLLLGRRGVFDGTVENMHLHWKYRELVKILSGERSIEEVHAVARTLEAESGGILVAVERVSKGHAIIVYRGKNYERPASLRPRTLLSKREALKRYVELQRRESLKLHVLKLSRNVDDLKLKLEKDKKDTDVQSANDSELLFNVEKRQSFECKGPETNLDISSATPASNQKTLKQLKGSDSLGADSMSVNPNGGMEPPGDNLEPTQQDILSEFSVMYGDEFDAAESLSDVSSDRLLTNQQASVSIFSGKYREEPRRRADSLKEANAVLEMNNRIGEVESVNSASASFKIPDDHKLRGQTSNSNIHSSESHLTDTKNQVPYVEPIYVPKESKSNRTSFRAARLSNKERLILRKQALKMKKRPVLAVGKSNIVTGVAKNIKAHFEKHPLAIVNVKGRAKGTSVQEVVAKLEEATGAVLVSQEPSKVILYRGWGAHEEHDQANRTKTRNHGNATDKPIISPELIAAIRLECRLQSNLEGKSVKMR